VLAQWQGGGDRAAERATGISVAPPARRVLAIGGVAMNPARSEMLGLEFVREDMPQVVARCLSWTREPRRSHILVTANASHLCMMRRDAMLRDACVAADLTVADGMSVVWALSLLGRPVPGRVAGIDLMTALLASASTEGLRVYLLGGRQDVLDALVAQCGHRYPGMVIAGARNGYFTADEHEAIVDEIRDSAPDLLFVGMPSPFKEVFCQTYRERLNVPIIIGVGGSFDVLAGFIRRAPGTVQKLGLEWAWRLGAEPRRLWKRYLTTNAEFISLVLREVWRERRGAKGAPRSEG
jgi:N-acetylglucosaminyldiphosphoundecaprenol N-acetyl-beta-D-mannosaminyltransferase